MATANNTYQTRVKLKTDTEANWNAHPIIPLLGEAIVYTPDASHNYSRLKIGDGQTSVTSLPFIDAGSLNGDESFILKYATFESFPSPGDISKLYIDLSTNNIYHYASATGYTRLMPFTITKTTIREVGFWGPGSATIASASKGILSIKNGVAPQLLPQNVSVVTNITGGVSV